MKHLLTICMILFVTMFALSCSSPAFTNEAEDVLADVAVPVPAAKIMLQIGNPMMTVDGQTIPIDEEGTVPLIQDSCTLLPVRAVVAAMGGEVAWEAAGRTVTLTCAEEQIQLTIDEAIAYHNGTAVSLDALPTIIHGRTMLPIRYIATSFGYEVDWDVTSRTVTLSQRAPFTSGQTATEEPPPAAVNDISFNFATRTVMLNSGYEMPLNGIGTYSLLDEVCVESVSAALACGVRLIDTAYMYHNEASVGEAVRNSGIPREEIFVITKLYPNQFANAEAAINLALEKLDIEYIDLMLLHHPGSNDVEAYLAMERAVADGKIRSIGLSNWYIKELEEFLPQINMMPALIQNEIHPYYQENDVIPYIQSLGIVVQGWYPLGGRGYTAELLENEVISEIAAAHGVSSAQAILRWNLQKGVVVIPGSSNPAHIQENTELYHFELTDEEMARINALDRNEKHDWY